MPEYIEVVLSTSMAQEELEKLKEAPTREKSRGSGLALMHFGKTCGVSASHHSVATFGAKL